MSNPLRPYVDVLLVCALEEERYVFEREFFSTNTEPRTMWGRKILVRDFEADTGHLHVALADLGGMGNVWAMDATLKLIDILSPRFAILFGLAGGSKKFLARGDVGFATGVGYSSFSKIMAGSLDEFINAHWETLSKAFPPSTTGAQLTAQLLAGNLRNAGVDPTRVFVNTRIKPRPAEALNVSPEFLDACWQASMPENARWRAKALEWLNSHKVGFRNWVNSQMAPDEKKYPEQLGMAGDPQALEVVIASGEAVIADDEHQKEIEALFPPRHSRTKELMRVGMFEMEAYGFAKACQVKGVHFGIAKGVSDYAGADKNVEEGNAFRLAAIASSSAFVAFLLKNAGFVKAVRAKKHTSWSQHACTWTADAHLRECTLVPNNPTDDQVFARRRPCTGPIHSPDSIQKHEVFRGNLFERVEAADYSNWLASAIEDESSNVLLVFPYSVRDLLTFLDFTDNAEMHQAIISIEHLANIRTRDAAQKKDLWKEVRKLGNAAKREYKHLEVSDNLSAKLILQGKSFAEIANQVCRVVFFKPDELEAMYENPSALLHLAVCGICVPTLIANQNIAKRFFADEATFIRSKNPAMPAGYVTQCLKFAERSKLLTLLGRCDDLPSNIDQGNIYGLAYDVFRYLKDHTKQSDLSNDEDYPNYKVFPAVKLLEKHGFKWGEFFPNKELQDAEKIIAEGYFSSLR